MKLSTYTAKGIKKDTITAPKNWSEKENMQLLAQAIRVYENKLHKGVSKTKRRGEIVASTRKIYRQKGTGRARHGALSAPIFVGGGKAHGPDGRKRTLYLPKKMKKKALNLSFKLKASENKVFVVNGLKTLKSTKEAAGLIKKILGKEKKVDLESSVLIALSNKNMEKERFFRNIANVKVLEYKNLNAHNVFFAGALMVDYEVFGKSKSKKKKKK